MPAHNVNWDAIDWVEVRPGMERKAFAGEGATLALFRIQPNHERLPHSHHYEQIVYMLRGTADFHVGDEVPSRVRFERGMRAAPSRAALIEHDDQIAFGIEETPRVDVAAAARTAVDEHRRLAVGVARLLVIDVVAVADGEIARVERLDRRILSPVAHEFSSDLPGRLRSTAFILTHLVTAHERRRLCRGFKRTRMRGVDE